MTRRSLILALALSLLGACGASPTETSQGDFVPDISERGSFHLQVSLDEGSFRRGSNPMTVRALTPEGEPAALLEVRARMPGHAHAEALAEVRAVDGAWRVDGLEMTMPGRWVITFRVAHEGVEDEALAVTSLR